MRFNARVGDYSRAGKAVARDFEKSLDVARTYSPKADEQVIAADTIRAKEKIAAMKIKGEITARGIRAPELCRYLVENLLVKQVPYLVQKNVLNATLVKVLLHMML